MQRDIAPVGLTDGHGQDGGDREEEEWNNVKAGASGVLANQHSVLGNQEDDCSEAGGDSRSDEEAGEDGGYTLATVPTPLDGVAASSGNTDTDEGGDDRVGSRDGPGVVGSDHEPSTGSHDGTGETEELHSSVVLEGSEIL